MPARSGPLRILQVVGALQGGGGEQIAVRLHRAIQARGHRSFLFAGRIAGTLEQNAGILPDRWSASAWSRGMQRGAQAVARLLGGRGKARIDDLFEALAYPRVAWDLWRGHEDFTQPGSRRLLNLAPEPPDVVILHNLHARWNRREGFFDLEYLPALSRFVPVILFPQDPWLLTGHCAHPIDCPRWRTGCGRCPDLAIYPSIARDATAENFRRKRRLFARSRLFLAAPSQWLLEMFRAAEFPMEEGRVIANGVDVEMFHPGDKREERSALGWDRERKAVLVSGNFLRTNPWKGFAWVEDAVRRLSERPDLPPTDIVCVGDDGPARDYGRVRLRFAGRVPDSGSMPRFYRAADAYFHPSRADTAPFSVLEAMSTGLPVVATRVGGIPEQVEEGKTGYLADPGDTRAMADRLAALLQDSALADALGAEGRRSVLARFDASAQADRMLEYAADIAARTPRRAG